jgi:hypothetical protein
MIIGLKFLILILGFATAFWAFLRWNGSIGPRYHLHEVAWRPARVVDESGLTPFQRLAESHIREMLSAEGFQLTERVQHDWGPSDRERHVQATIAGTPLTVWIYLDGGGISAPGIDRRFEDWDAATPEDLAKEFAVTAVELARKHRDHAA